LDLISALHFPTVVRDTHGVESCWENKGAPTLPFLSWVAWWCQCMNGLLLW